ncbi:MAG: glycosyltransferase family 4 protein [Candidatus Woesebacteria bacterium]|nr:MAG: glycosyltransferase family 4 protein [Candidatus Woesebacteria bacterium]
MNILVFSWRGPKHPLAGGAEQVDHEHHKGWIKAGHKVVLFTSNFKKGKEKEIIDGVKIIRRGNQILGVHLSAFLWYFLKKHPKFDLVVDEFHGIPFFTPLYIKEKKMVVLQEVAGKVWLKNELIWPLNLIIGFLGYLFEPLIYKLYKKVPFMVGSNSAKIALEKIGIQKKDITVVQHGVITKKQTKKIIKEKIKTIIFLGTLAKDKGIEDALKVFSILKSKREFQFWVVGKSDTFYLKKLKKMSKNLKISKQIKFWGYVSSEKKFELLSKAHLLLNPSILEGWGLVNIEANAMKIPVVAYNSPGLVDSVQNGFNGLICKNNSPENMAQNIEKIFASHKLYLKLKKNSLIWSKNFSWDKSRKLSLNLINEITNNA